MAIQPEFQVSTVSFDGLYCEEEKWMDDEDAEDDFIQYNSGSNDANGGGKVRPFRYPSSLLIEEAMVWDEEELISLLSKEKQQYKQTFSCMNKEDTSLLSERKEAAEWILKANACYGFSALTSALAINYLDRFLLSICYRRNMTWMIELVAVACLSLAAKVEETDVPLLEEFQLEKRSYFFKAKDIQSMELLVLSTLQWKMHPVTPISFLDHIVRRLRLKNHLHWEFLRRCEHVIISLVSDSRSMFILPSEIAASAMLHVIRQVEPLTSMEYQSQLLGALKMNMEKVNEWCELIQSLPRTSIDHQLQCKSTVIDRSHPKRKYPLEQAQPPRHGSPSGVIDAAVFNSDASNDSWAVQDDGSPFDASEEPALKKSRAQRWI